MKHALLFRSMFCLIMVFMLFVPHAQALNSCLDENSRSLSVACRNSYAWNEEYLFVARGYTKENEYLYDWGNNHYSLSRVDRDTGRVTLIEKDYPYFYFNLHIDGDTLYILRQYYNNPDLIEFWKESGTQENMPAYAEGETTGTVHLIAMSFDGTISNTIRFDFGTEVLDSIISGGRLYAITKYSVFECDVHTGEKEEVYVSDSRLSNLLTRYHAILNEDELYLQTADHRIIALNLDDYSIKNICTSPALDEYPKIQKGHDYIVLADQLYFWDDDMQKMLACDLNDGSLKIISDHRYSFVNASDEGVAAYLTYNENSEVLYFRYQNPEHPSFEPDSTVPVLMGAEDIVLIDNNQFINDAQPFEIQSLQLFPSIEPK